MAVGTQVRVKPGWPIVGGEFYAVDEANDKVVPLDLYVNPGNGNVIARPRGDDGGVDQDPLAPTSRRLDPDIDQI